MAAEEHSRRALDLTTHIISLNPAHYTVWLYRFAIVSTLSIPFASEMAWLNEMALEHQKNYQIWHHRQLLVSMHLSSIADDAAARVQLGESEVTFMDEMFEEDAKNYHVWSYRQWMVRALSFFGAWEVAATERWIEHDVRNNSAWSHRFFLIFSNPAHCTPDLLATQFDPRIPAAIADGEIAYAQRMVQLAPQNQSPWNYLRGVLRKTGRPLDTLVSWAEEFAQLRGQQSEKGTAAEDAVQSSHALELLADAWAEKGDSQRADRAWELLGAKYDCIRRPYWEWKREAARSSSR